MSQIKLRARYRKNYERMARDNIEHDSRKVEYKQQQELKLAGYLRNHVANLGEKKVLDLGCAEGYFLEYLRECNLKLGGDISLTYCRYAKNKGFMAVQMDAEALPFKALIDVVVASDILEHVLDLNMALKSIHQALKKKGTLLLRVPYKEDISKYKRNGFKYEFAHLRNFDEKRIRAELNGLFEIKKFYYDGFAYYGTWLTGVWQKIFHKSFGKLIDLVYEGRWELMPNWLGVLVCRPIEIVVVANKI